MTLSETVASNTLASRDDAAALVQAMTAPLVNRYLDIKARHLL